LGHEYEYIFEARDCPRHLFCWKRFYFGVRGLEDNANILNRRRIWELIYPLRNLLSGFSFSPCNGTPLHSFFEPDAPSNELPWTSASRAVVDPEAFFTSGCRALRIRQITLPSSITAVFVSFVNFNNQRYVSGFRFRQRD